MVRRTEFEGLQWKDFLKRMSTDWEPGEHWGLIVPTGGGKTTFAGGLVQTRKYVLALDVKGGDKTLKKLGWERMTKWPPSREDRKDMEDGKPFRRIVGNAGRDPASKAKRFDLLHKVLQEVGIEGGWTVLATDLKLLTHPRFGGLWGEVEELILLARDIGVSVITDMQRPTGQPRESSDQATWLAVGPSRDTDAASRLGEMMGRSRAEMRGAISALGDLPHGFLVVNRKPNDPIIITQPEKL